MAPKGQRDSTDRVFAEVVRTGTVISLVILFVFGILYLAGFNTHVDISSAAQNWSKPVSQFWRDVEGMEVSDYSWFLFHLPRSDAMSAVGIVLLALTPLAAMLCIVWRMRGLYLLFCLIIIAGFLFSLFRPYL
jgi:hypothetical protein